MCHWIFLKILLLFTRLCNPRFWLHRKLLFRLCVVREMAISATSNHCICAVGMVPQPIFPQGVRVRYWLSIQQTKPRGPRGAYGACRRRRPSSQNEQLAVFHCNSYWCHKVSDTGIGAVRMANRRCTQGQRRRRTKRLFCNSNTKGVKGARARAELRVASNVLA